MNKKFTLLAAALMTVGTFTAASAASDDWTVGNYYRSEERRVGRVSSPV